MDLSVVEINGRTVDGDRLPSPFTPKGDRPAGPAWYATPSVRYAVELGRDIAPIELYVRTRTGRYPRRGRRLVAHAAGRRGRHRTLPVTDAVTLSPASKSPGRTAGRALTAPPTLGRWTGPTSRPSRS
ncbi:hypothetical protein JOF35_005003 [Streptomyces demainii]|uniref:Uncharacterized protein n=1 Tax=Streptomyces demainii TaxID=588122 RepID=A0ABT9KZF6_9ACTN|nr:hypothetical protein [Streptomyces demainii]